MTREEATNLFREWSRLDLQRPQTLQEILRGNASNSPLDADVPNLGWRVASLIAKRSPDQIKLMRSSGITGQHAYRWVRAAVTLRRNGERLGKWFPEVADVAAASDLHADPRITVTLKAALFSTNSTPETVAHVMSLAVPVVQAFDALFFNVLDRKDDLLCRRKIVEDDNGYGRNLIRKITGERGWPDLLKIASEGTLQDVMVAACISMQEETEDSLVRKTRMDALRAVAGNNHGSKSPLTALGVAIAKEWQDSEAAEAQTGTLDDPFLKQLLTDSANYNEVLRAKHRGEAPES
jgi:hypothetical protein